MDSERRQWKIRALDCFSWPGLISRGPETFLQDWRVSSLDVCDGFCFVCLFVWLAIFCFDNVAVKYPRRVTLTPVYTGFHGIPGFTPLFLIKRKNYKN